MVTKVSKEMNIAFLFTRNGLVRSFLLLVSFKLQFVFRAQEIEYLSVILLCHVKTLRYAKWFPQCNYALNLQNLFAFYTESVTFLEIVILTYRSYFDVKLML